MKKQESADGSTTETKTTSGENGQSTSFKSLSMGCNQDSKTSKTIDEVASVKELYGLYKEKVTIAGYTAILNTPFSILHVRDLENKTATKYMLSCGAEVICDRIFKSEDEAKEYIEQPKWDIIWNVVNLLLSTIKTKENE